MDKLIESGAIVLGGVMHRFKNDHAIRTFCAYSGMEHPTIDDQGAIWAMRTTNEAGDMEDIQIGWTF